MLTFDLVIVLVLIGALFWALHIIYIGKIIDQFDLPFFIALIQNLNSSNFIFYISNYI